MELKYFSTFSGIGGFELGIKNKAKCVGFSEINKYATEIYKKHFPKHKNYGDITTINASELPNFDLLVGGFPCQSFSIAGKRKGFEDTRGTLFFDLARILQAKQPKLFIFENVKGLLSHNGGQTFKTIIATLVELGYNLQWQVLNSKNHGVPQNRERVYIVGNLGGFGGRKVFPIGETMRKDNESSKGQASGCINAGEGKVQNSNTFIIKQLNNSTNSNNRVYKDGLQIRKLTPTECERLQGFPDGWTEGVSDTQRYKCLGNAVTVNVVSEIIKNIL